MKMVDRRPRKRYNNTDLPGSFLSKRGFKMGDRRDSKNRKLNKGEYQREDGRYAYRFTDVDGKVRWVYSWKLTATDSAPKGKSCRKCLRDLEIEIAKKIVSGERIFTTDVPTLNEVFENYIFAKSKLRDTTKNTYRSLWRTHVEESIGKRRVDEIKYSDVVRFLSELSRKRLKPSTVKSIYNLMRPPFDVAVKDDIIRKNPVDGALGQIFENGKTKKEKRHSLTIVQQNTFLTFLRETPRYRRRYRLFIFLIGTGCRIGEARGVTWDDCDFERGLITIRRQVSYYKAEGEAGLREHVVEPKTDSGIRVVPMLTEVKEVLLEELADQRSEAKTVDGVTGLIFQTKKGGCLDAANVDRAIDSIVRRYNAAEEAKALAEGRTPEFLPHFSAHNLRHTFCTRLCENETNLKVIQEVMGHADISTTMNVYNEVMEEARSRSFSGLEGKIV